MKIKVLGSSSAGNCYILENDTEALILECGISLPKVKKALGWNLKKVVGALATHSHNDHSGYVADMAAAGITVMALPHVLESHNIIGKPFTKSIEPGKGYKVGNFRFYGIRVYHDVPCLAYVIMHPEMGRLLFVTDAVSLSCIVPGVNHFLVEANYADDILEHNIQEGRYPISLRQRLLTSHMEIKQTLNLIEEQDTGYLQNIVLIHLSDGNSDEDRFVNEVKGITNASVFAAKNGMQIDINATPY